MSTQSVNANRLGPKNLMDLAQKAQAYKALLTAKENLNAPDPSQGLLRPGGKAAAAMGMVIGDARQTHLDDAFEHFADLHRHPETGKVDTNEMQATMAYLDAHIAKGKGI